MNWPIVRHGRPRLSVARTWKKWQARGVGDSVNALLGSWRRSTMDSRAIPPSASEPRIRYELVQRIRREIAAGIYETPEKLEIALERLLASLEEE